MGRPTKSGPVRTSDQRTRDRAEIARYHIRKLQAWEIVELMNDPQRSGVVRPYALSRDMVHDDLQAIRAEWRAARHDEATVRNAALAAVDELERTYWRAWDASQQPRETTLQETQEVRDAQQRAGVPAGPATRHRARVSRIHPVGNPAFLEGVQWCIAKRCSILGIDRASDAGAQATGQLVLISQIPGLRAIDGALADAALADVAAARRAALGLPPPTAADQPVIDATAVDDDEEEDAPPAQDDDGSLGTAAARGWAQIAAMAASVAQDARKASSGPHILGEG